MGVRELWLIKRKGRGTEAKSGIVELGYSFETVIRMAYESAQGESKRVEAKKDQSREDGEVSSVWLIYFFFFGWKSFVCSWFVHDVSLNG
jgi:hypothetical protein